MSSIYEVAQISKQGHAQNLAREQAFLDQIPICLGLIDQVREFHPSMGLRTIYETYQPEGIGRDAFIALGLESGYRLRSYRSAMITTRRGPGKVYANLLDSVRVTDVNQVWVSDLFYYRLRHKDYYVVLIMDAYSRRIIGYSGANNMRAENNLRALQMALTLRGINRYDRQLIHHSDRGSQYTSEAYTGLLKEREIRISMCQSALENAHSERVNGTIKNDYLRAWGVQTTAEFFTRLPQAVHNYNHRPHQSLKKMSPIEFEIFLKSVPKEKKDIMEFFTMNITSKQPQNPNQLSLDL